MRSVHRWGRIAAVARMELYGVAPACPIVGATAAAAIKCLGAEMHLHSLTKSLDNVPVVQHVHAAKDIDCSRGTAIHHVMGL